MNVSFDDPDFDAQDFFKDVHNLLDNVEAINEGPHICWTRFQLAATRHVQVSLEAVWQVLAERPHLFGVRNPENLSRTDKRERLLNHCDDLRVFGRYAVHKDRVKDLVAMHTVRYLGMKRVHERKLLKHLKSLGIDRENALSGLGRASNLKKIGEKWLVNRLDVSNELDTPPRVAPPTESSKKKKKKKKKQRPGHDETGPSSGVDGGNETENEEVATESKDVEDVHVRYSPIPLYTEEEVDRRANIKAEEIARSRFDTMHEQLEAELRSKIFAEIAEQKAKDMEDENTEVREDSQEEREQVIQDLRAVVNEQRTAIAEFERNLSASQEKCLRLQAICGVLVADDMSINMRRMRKVLRLVEYSGTAVIAESARKLSKTLWKIEQSIRPEVGGPYAHAAGSTAVVAATRDVFYKVASHDPRSALLQIVTDSSVFVKYYSTFHPVMQFLGSRWTSELGMVPSSDWQSHACLLECALFATTSEDFRQFTDALRRGDTRKVQRMFDNARQQKWVARTAGLLQMAEDMKA